MEALSSDGREYGAMALITHCPKCRTELSVPEAVALALPDADAAVRESVAHW